MLRILSDLHFRDAASRFRRLEDLEPLLEGIDELWLNGDTCDNQTGMSAADVEAIRQFFRTRVPTVRFLTGNHDPDLSTEHWCATPDGRVCATHGDAFFAGARSDAISGPKSTTRVSFHSGEAITTSS